MPVFSHHIFASKGIDAKKNYEFFYPNSTWTGDNGFNVSNASVKEYQIITNNGYIYNVDRVLEPLETIYDVLKKKSDYSNTGRRGGEEISISREKEYLRGPHTHGPPGETAITNGPGPPPPTAGRPGRAGYNQQNGNGGSAGHGL